MICLVSGCRRVYPPVPRYALWIMTEIAIIGSDIQEVIGSAIAISILTNRRVPIWAGVLITACDSFAILLIERLGVRILEAVFAGLIGTMAVSFGVMYFWAEVPTSKVLEGQSTPSKSSLQDVYCLNVSCRCCSKSSSDSQTAVMRGKVHHCYNRSLLIRMHKYHPLWSLMYECVLKAGSISWI